MMMMSYVVVAFNVIMTSTAPMMSSVDGFAFGAMSFSASSRRSFDHRRHHLLYLSDQPSDTSSDPYYDVVDDDANVVVTVDSEDFVPSDNDVLVTSILDLVPVSMVAGSSSVSDEKRAEINEALLKLEALNPTPQPALSPLLNGIWELKYAGNYATQGAIMSPTRQIALFLYSGTLQRNDTCSLSSRDWVPLSRRLLILLLLLLLLLLRAFNSIGIRLATSTSISLSELLVKSYPCLPYL